MRASLVCRLVLVCLAWILLLLAAAVVCPLPAQAQTGERFFDDFESGVSGWSFDPTDTNQNYWHLVTDTQQIRVAPDIAARLVRLPDAGHLPGAYSGRSAMWFGQESTGTFIGADYASIEQTENNGGQSTGPHSGCLVSPGVDLVGISSAYLHFKTWWEIEGVDTPTYDQMAIGATGAGGWIARLNPVNDVDGELFRPYTSGGLGQPGQWADVFVDLSAHTGRALHMIFCFDTNDHRYNGFRGWLIDDVRVVATGLQPPTISEVAPPVAQANSFISIRGENFVSGATVTVGGQASAVVSVVSTNEIQVQVPALGPGDTELVVTNPDGQRATSPFAVTTNSAPTVTSLAPTSGVDNAVIHVVIRGTNFAVGARAFIATTELTNVQVRQEGGQSILEADVPVGLPGGYQNVTVLNPDGQRSLLTGGYQVQAVISPATASLGGQTITAGPDGVIRIRTGIGRPINLQVPVDCGYDSEGNRCWVRRVTATNGNTTIDLTGPREGGIWTGTIGAAASGPITISVECECPNGQKKNSVRNIADLTLIDPSGFIYDASTGDQTSGTRVQGATVVLYHKHPQQGDIVWDAKVFKQVNPQTSDPNGRYGWDVPAGDYYIRVTHPCYEPLTSQVVTIPPPVTDLNVGLTPNDLCLDDFYLPLATRMAYQLAVSEEPEPPTDLVNGDFEAGATGWDQFSALGYDVIMSTAVSLPAPPRSGQWLAWLGGADSEIAGIEQTVEVPADRPVLSYWHWIGSQDQCGYDMAGVLVNGDVVDQYDLCAETETGGWVRHTVSLAAYAGQSVRLQFRAETDASMVSNLLVDDITFTATDTAALAEPAPAAAPTSLSTAHK